MSDNANKFKADLLKAIAELRGQNDLLYPDALIACLEVVSDYAQICVAGLVNQQDLAVMRAQAKEAAVAELVAKLRA